jgi:hypothetical protein
MDPQTPQRLRAFLSRNKIDSFFAELDSVQREIGSDNLPQWCAEHLQMKFSAVMRWAKFLSHDNMQRNKRTFADAVKADKADNQAARDRKRYANDPMFQTLLRKLAMVEAELKDLKTKGSGGAEVASLRSENAQLREEIARLMAELAAANMDTPRERRCRHCGDMFMAQSLAAKFCSVRCRVASHRSHQRAEAT